LPRNKEQNEQIRRQRKETIIRSALNVYVDKGYAAAEIGDVAKHAGIARGLVYYYFKDKRGLFRELFTYMFDQSIKHVHLHFAQEGFVYEILERFVSSMYMNMLEQSDSVMFFMRMRHDQHELFTPDELKSWNWYIEFMKVIQKALESGMESGEVRRMSPQLLASQYWGAMIHGQIHLRQWKQELQEQGKDKEEIIQLIKRDIEDAVVCVMSLVAPPLQDTSDGDDGQ
jgi:TetR/AcrR family transcriptional regulator